MQRALDRVCRTRRRHCWSGTCTRLALGAGQGSSTRCRYLSQGNEIISELMQNTSEAVSAWKPGAQPAILFMYVTTSAWTEAFSMLRHLYVQ